MKFINLIFYRLLYLYRAEKDGALESASNYLALIILVTPISIIGTIANIFFRPESGWGNYARWEIALFAIPICVLTSYLILKYHKKNINYAEAEKHASKLKFTLFTSWCMIVILLFMPAILRPWLS